MRSRHHARPDEYSGGKSQGDLVTVDSALSLGVGVLANSMFSSNCVFASPSDQFGLRRVLRPPAFSFQAGALQFGHMRIVLRLHPR